MDSGFGDLTKTVKLRFDDFYATAGDRLSLQAIDPAGNHFGEGDAQQVLGFFDSNHDGQLDTSDAFVKSTGHGIELDWWNVKLQLDGVQHLSADWLV